MHEAKITITTFLIAHRKRERVVWGKEWGRTPALVESFQNEESLVKPKSATRKVMFHFCNYGGDKNYHYHLPNCSHKKGRGGGRGRGGIEKEQRVLTLEFGILYFQL